MSAKNLLSVAVAAGSLLAAGVASAAATVTFNPQGNGVSPNIADVAFQAVGFQSNLTSTLVINGVSGVQGFSETGRVDVTSFQNPGPVSSGVNIAGHYGIYATFALSGVGSWAPSNVYTASPGSLTFSISLFADPGLNGPAGDILLGTASLANDPTNFAFAILNPAPAAGGSGVGVTTLSSLLRFTPQPGFEGPGKFFQAPTPFLIDFAIGNAGGNAANTTYTVSAGGVVTVSTTGTGANPGTANATFLNTVPEPSALSLVGIALLGVAYAGKRKTKAASI